MLPPSPEHPCAYLPGRVARDRGFAVSSLGPDAWQTLLDTGWRRAGVMIYQPACPVCRDCVPLRIPVGRFRPSRTQRRTLKANADVTVTLTRPQVTDERAALYRRYITSRHTGLMTGSRRELETFLGVTPVETHELEYRLGERLVAIGTVDRLPKGWSCVYCYYDPDETRRSLGTFNVLTTIDLALRTHGPDAFVYLGYWVSESDTMDYKTKFKPYELLGPDGRWSDAHACQAEPVGRRDRSGLARSGG